LNLVSTTPEKRNATLNNLLLAFHNFGFEINLPRELVHVTSNVLKTSTESDSTHAAPPRSLRDQMVEVHSALQAITSTVQALALSNSEELQQVPQHQQQQQAQNKEKGQEVVVLGKEYLGTNEGGGIASGCNYAYWDSSLLTIDSYDEHSGNVTGKLKITELRKECDGKSKVDPSHPLSSWIKSLEVLDKTVAGNFDKTKKLLTISDQTSTGHVSNFRKYFLVLLPDKLVGVAQMIKPRNDMADPLSTTPMVLDQLK